MNAAATGTKSIVVEFDVPQAPAKVWRALTEPDLVAKWLMASDIQPVVGHRFQFRAQPVPGWDGTVDCEMLEVEPERKLRYTWRGGSRDIAAGGYGRFLDTSVTWSLSPTPNGGTHVLLEHAGFTPEDSFAYENMANGWRSNVSTALARVVGELS